METTSGALNTPATHSGDQFIVGKRSLRDRLAAKEWIIFLLFVAPNFFFLFMFVYWPLWENVKLSLYRTNLLVSTGNNKWVGLDNYRYIFDNRTFQLVLRN
ncbi:MAG TPA: hypothetical protein VEW66_01700, partial [Thermomicrobiales bacterium]|nr:hypothetical protein [Thermomicrobiales bacterium]